MEKARESRGQYLKFTERSDGHADVVVWLECDKLVEKLGLLVDLDPTQLVRKAARLLGDVTRRTEKLLLILREEGVEIMCRRVNDAVQQCEFFHVDRTELSSNVHLRREILQLEAKIKKILAKAEATGYSVADAFAKIDKDGDGTVRARARASERRRDGGRGRHWGGRGSRDTSVRAAGHGMRRCGHNVFFRRGAGGLRVRGGGGRSASWTIATASWTFDRGAISPS